MSPKKKFRVCRRYQAKGTTHWGVQRLDGYTDGKPSWRLATRQAFWSREAAEAYLASAVAASHEVDKATS